MLHVTIVSCKAGILEAHAGARPAGLRIPERRSRPPHQATAVLGRLAIAAARGFQKRLHRSRPDDLALELGDLCVRELAQPHRVGPPGEQPANLAKSEPAVLREANDLQALEHVFRVAPSAAPTLG